MIIDPPKFYTVDWSVLFFPLANKTVQSIYKTIQFSDCLRFMSVSRGRQPACYTVLMVFLFPMLLCGSDLTHQFMWSIMAILTRVQSVQLGKRSGRLRVVSNNSSWVARMSPSQFLQLSELVQLSTSVNTSSGNPSKVNIIYFTIAAFSMIDKVSSAILRCTIMKGSSRETYQQ